MECYKLSSAAGKPLALTVFVSGRGRLENEGSIALAEVFKVSTHLSSSGLPIERDFGKNNPDMENFCKKY